MIYPGKLRGEFFLVRSIPVPVVPAIKSVSVFPHYFLASG
jgi:hypothetical protein